MLFVFFFVFFCLRFFSLYSQVVMRPDISRVSRVGILNSRWWASRKELEGGKKKVIPRIFHRTNLLVDRRWRFAPASQEANELFPKRQARTRQPDPLFFTFSLHPRGVFSVEGEGQEGTGLRQAAMVWASR